LLACIRARHDDVTTSSWTAVVLAMLCDKLGFEVGLALREEFV
jgi:hypothetical protein